jgi:hypothetical protein
MQIRIGKKPRNLDIKIGPHNYDPSLRGGSGGGRCVARCRRICLLRIRLAGILAVGVWLIGIHDYLTILRYSGIFNLQRGQQVFCQ